MSNFQNYLNDITKKAQEITTRNLNKLPKTSQTGKKKQLKLSKNDISALTILRDKAKTAIPQGVGSREFAKLTNFGKNYIDPTKAEGYQKAQALKFISKSGLNTGSYDPSRLAGKSSYGVTQPIYMWTNVDSWNANPLRKLFEKSSEKVEAKKSQMILGMKVIKKTDYNSLISKDKVVSILSDPKKYGKYLSDTQAEYFKKMFSSELADKALYTYNYKNGQDGKKYLRIGTENIIFQPYLQNKELLNRQSELAKFLTVDASGKRSINEKELWKQEYLSKFEQSNANFKNILNLAKQESLLLDKYANSSQMFGSMQTGEYNKLIVDAEANKKKMYDSINQYLDKATLQKSEWNIGPSYYAENKKYKYLIDDANKFAQLTESGYKLALNELTKTLGISQKEFETTKQTQENTVKQLTNILNVQKQTKRPTGNVVASRRAALDIAVSKDRPSYSGITKRATFIERPN